MSPDVIRIVLGYVRPERLREWFEKWGRYCGLNFDFKFVYDAKHYELDAEKMKIYFGEFSNIVLVGANVVVDGNNMWKMDMGNIRDLRIQSRTKSFVDFPDCPKLKNLELCCPNGWNVNHFRMFHAPKLKKISFVRCGDIDMKDVFGKMCGVNVKTILCDEFYISSEDMHCMRKLPVLDTLIFNNCMNYTIGSYEYNFLRVKRLENRGSKIFGIEKYVILGCKSLQYLVVGCWDRDVDFRVLYECAKLRTVDIVCEGKDLDLDLSRFTHLRSFRFNGREMIG